VKAYPANSRYKLNLANYYVKIGETKKAKKVLNKLKNEDSSVAVEDYLGTAAEGDKRISVIRSVRTEIPQTSISIDKKITGLIPVLESLNKEFSEPVAAELLLAAKDLVNLYPDNPKAYALQADVYNTKGDTDAAIASYKETIELNSSVFDVWYQLMRIQRDEKLYDDLFRTSDEALLRFPNQAIAYLFNAYSLNRKNDPEEAIDILQEAVLISSDNEQLRLTIKTEMAYSKFLQGEYEAALKILDSEANESPTATELYGDIYSRQGNKEKAVQFWKKALDGNPNNQELATKIQNKQI